MVGDQNPLVVLSAYLTLRTTKVSHSDLCSLFGVSLSPNPTKNIQHQSEIIVFIDV